MRITWIALGVWLGASAPTAVAAEAPPPPPAPAQAPAPVPAPTTAPAPATPSSKGGGQVRGTISYGRRAPAAGVVVIIKPDGSGKHIYAATTGEAGTFAFDGVADGTYRGEARREGYTPIVKTGIVVRAPFRAVVELLLTKGSSPVEPPPSAEGAAALTGRVRVEGGVPVGEVRVRLVRGDAGSDPRTVLTDAAGTFTFTGLEAGRWKLEAMGAGLLPLRADLDLVGEMTIDLGLARQPTSYKPLPQDLIIPEDVIPPKVP
jgi:Carboxypeptidase regulatory-like domain